MLPDRLDELEHQALDRLEELERDDELGADDREAIERVQAGFERLLIGEAERLLAAAEQLAIAEPARAIDRDALARVRAHLVDDPRRAPALAPALELIGLGLGLAREGLAWALLIERSEAAARDAPADFAAISSSLTAILREVWPRPDAPAPSPGLRVFRVAALADAGPSIRARSLAAEHPEHLRLATAILLANPEASPSELLDAFAAARARLELPIPEEVAPEPASEGPKRRFTWVHALLAAIILGLTLWHYLLR
ncbi:hypothetical protein ACNOYE_39280 [Nannocystaceae bacterium ST9]